MSPSCRRMLQVCPSRRARVFSCMAISASSSPSSRARLSISPDSHCISPQSPSEMPRQRLKPIASGRSQACRRCRRRTRGAARPTKRSGPGPARPRPSARIRPARRRSARPGTRTGSGLRGGEAVQQRGHLLPLGVQLALPERGVALGPALFQVVNDPERLARTLFRKPLSKPKPKQQASPKGRKPRVEVK